MVVQAVEQHALLLQGLELTSGLIPRLRVIEDLYLRSQAKQARDLLGKFQESLVSICSRILEFQARALCYLHRHSASQLWRNIFNLDTWPDLLDDFERLEKSIYRFTPLIADAESSRRHEEVLEGHREIMNALHERDIWTTTSARDERMRKFFKLLYTCPYKDRKDRNSKRVPGTCEWFTGHPLFQAWQNGTSDVSSGLLWVSADPGCGKSVLTRYLVDELLLNTSERTVCYFFFKDDFPDQRSATSAFSSLLRQLFIAQPQLLQDSILDKLDTDGDTLVQSFSELWNILMSVSANPKAGEIICVLDALDECQDRDRDQLIRAVKDFYVGPYKKSKLKFLITSRPYDHIRRGFWELEAKLPTIHLSGDGEEEAQQISREIDLVIRKRVDVISEQRCLEEDERSMLTQQLTAFENRTYLWVSLTLDVLENIPGFTKGNIRRVIQHLPPTVDGAYERILDRSLDADKARVLLHIITAATRPLSLGELSLALAISAGHRAFTDIMDEVEPEDRFRKTLRDICGLLVVVIDEKVYLLHQTAKEFLVRGNNSAMNKNVTRWKHSLLPEESNQILADICTYYLTFDQNGIEQEVFAEYSSCYWTVHFRQACVRDGNPIIIRAKNICNPISDVYHLWSRIYVRNGNVVPKGAESISIVSALGLAGVVKLLLETGNVDVDSQDSEYGRTPLSWAAGEGYEAVVKLLLDTGKVDVNSKDSEYGQTPLSWAAEYGHEAVVKLLLNTGKVDVDSQDKYGQTPLSLAAWNGNKAVVKLLLDTGKVDVDSKDSEYGQTPLSFAAENGHEAVVKLLLNTGKVDVNSKDSEYSWTPLSWAAENGHEAVVKLLLHTGKVDVDSKSSDNRTPLSFTAENGHEAVVKLLLDTGKVDADSKSSDNRTPLSWAAGQGHEAVVKLLLDTEKVDVDSKDKYGRTPLSLAALNGHEAVVKLLLDTGKVDADSKSSDNRTPLSWAAGQGHEAVVKLLLDTRKVDVDSKSSDNRTPLSLAALYGHDAVVKLLLHTGKVDVDSKSSYNRTPLSFAAENGHEAVVKLLLDTGNVDVDSKDPKYGRTPLSWSAREGHEAVVKLLLDTGKVDVDSQDSKYGQTPLSFAAENGHEAVVKLLLNTGKVDVDSKSSDNWTLLSWAAGQGHEAVVKLLLETEKVDADSQDSEYGRTPLS
jgi:ankyrin repeat protein